jgi:threonylcarbamoyladenosine tRNA methylthiotransferase CDKAL1
MDLLRDKKIYVETYGCTYNHADTQKLITLAEAQGCRQVEPDEAEVFLINTCTVISATERTMLRRIQAFSDREIVVTGCMPVIQLDRIKEICSPRVILPDHISERCDRVGAVVSPGVGIVQTASGCLGRCSYCITRKARGSLKSMPPEAILREVELLVREGAREIQLTGQDLSAYGTDIGTNLALLLEEISDLPGPFAVRVGMMNPATTLPILEDLVAAFRSPRIFSFLHLPVQSGSDAVLDAMRRGYGAGDFVHIVDAFREAIPDLRLSTDFIVGFPTETDDDFARSLALVRRTEPHKVNITRFSMRPGTPVAAQKDLPDRVKKERSRALTCAANAVYDRMNTAFIGREMTVLVTEEKVPGTVVARNCSYQNIVIRERLPLGSYCRVRITGHRRHYLVASRLPGSGAASFE